MGPIRAIVALIITGALLGIFKTTGPKRTRRKICGHEARFGRARQLDSSRSIVGVATDGRLRLLAQLLAVDRRRGQASTCGSIRQAALRGMRKYPCWFRSHHEYYQ
jgi:hypothetical protein